MRGQHGPNVLWKDEHTAALVGLVGKLSFANAAAEINARFGTSYSRNAAIGKAARLGLVTPAPKRDPQDIAATRRARQERTNERSKAKRRAAGIPAVTPRWTRAELKTELLCVAVDPMGISLLDLEAGQCRWPDGDGPFTFCGHPQFGSSSYCRRHFFKSIGRGTPSEQGAHRGAWR